MARHVAYYDLTEVGASRVPRPGLRALAVLIALAVVGGAIGVFVLGPRKAYALLPFTASTACRQVAVEVSAAPAAAALVRAITQPIQGTDLGQGQCLGVQVIEQDPVQTVAGSAVLPADRAPDVWIPDSSLWAPRVKAWRMQQVSNLAFSPIVLASSREAMARLGWDRTAPAWADMMRGHRPVALSDVDQNADTLISLVALWQSMGRDRDATEAVAGALIAADRGRLPTPSTALAAAQSGSAQAPLLPTTEQWVYAANNGDPHPEVMAVYPRDGSPVLDYPILVTQAASATTAVERGVDVVLARLTSPAARQTAVLNGFRVSPTSGPVATGLQPGAVKIMMLPPQQDITALVARLEILARPSRMLAVIDVSTSMAAPLPGGLTRIQLSAAAARGGADLLPDRASAGLWIFARRLHGEQDWRELVPVAPLGATDRDGQTHRAALKAVTSRVSKRLAPGGTGLYDTALAAVRSVRASYDPRAVNSVVIFTDGANDRAGGQTLDGLVAALRAGADPKRPVLLFGIGIGPDADMAALRTLTKVTGGMAWSVDNPDDMRQALLEGLTHRPAQPAAGG